MHQFHMVAIVCRLLTKNPQLEAGKELLDLAYRMTGMRKDAFSNEFDTWKRKWHDFPKEKNTNGLTEKTIFIHQV